MSLYRFCCQTYFPRQMLILDLALSPQLFFLLLEITYDPPQLLKPPQILGPELHRGSALDDGIGKY